MPQSNDITDRVSAWRGAIASGDAEAIGALYSPDAILMGIGETAIRLGRREIAEHYSGLFEGKPQIRFEEPTVEGSCGAAVVVGRMQVALEGQRAPVDVMSRMMFAFGEGAWLMVHHHLETPVGFEMIRSSAATDAPNDIVTGSTNPPLPTAATVLDLRSRNDTIELPEPAFSLPQAPPVWLTPLPTDALSLSKQDKSAPTSEDRGELVKAAEAVVDVVVPGLEITVGTLPDVVLPPAVTRAAPVVDKPKTLVIVPKAVSPAKAPPVAPAVEKAWESKPVAVEAAKPSARPPAVASFSQRAPEPAPPRIIPPPPKVVAAPKPAPSPPARVVQSVPRAEKPVAATQPTAHSDYRPGRWIDGVPVFGSDEKR